MSKHMQSALKRMMKFITRENLPSKLKAKHEAGAHCQGPTKDW